MQNVVKLTRNGQTTIPAEIREELGIKEGGELAVEATKQGALFKRIPRLEVLAGILLDMETARNLEKKLTDSARNITCEAGFGQQIYSRIPRYCQMILTSI